MKTRAALCIAAIASTAVTGAAHAAAKKPKPKPVPPVCNLIKDDAGDAKGLNGANDQLDVLSADVASDAKNVTALIRLKATPSADDQNAAMGKVYTLDFAPAKDVVIHLAARLTKLGGATFSATTGTTGFKAGTATGSISGTTARITATVAALGATVKPGAVFTGLKVSSAYLFTSSSGIPMAEDSLTGTSPSDAAESKAVYTAGAKSCVAP